MRHRDPHDDPPAKRRPDAYRGPPVTLGDIRAHGVRRLRRGVRGRLISHRRSKRKGDLWTHFSVFQVWDNIRDDEVAELEGLFRHIYRRDLHANRLNIQRGFKRARHLPRIDLKKAHPIK
jgi:hypothetical protein